jgi:acyl carrier protein
MKNKILDLIIDAFDDIRDDYPDAELSHPAEKTPLFGKRGIINSLGLVSLIVGIEERVSEEFELDVVIADERAMSQKASPFLSIGSLARYIEKLLGDPSDE